MTLIRFSYYGAGTVSILGALIAFLYGLWSLLQPLKISTRYDALILPLVQEELNEVLVSKTNQIWSYGAHGLLHELKQQFPLLKSLALSYKSSQVVQVELRSAEPILLIQDAVHEDCYVLTRQGVISGKLYNLNVLPKKNSLHVVNADFITEISSPFFYDCVCKFEDKLFQDYDITWYSQHEIILKAKNNDQLLIVADITSVHDQGRLAFAQKMYEQEYPELQKNVPIGSAKAAVSNMTSRKKVGQVTVKMDIRLQDFMVRTRLRGGGL